MITKKLSLIVLSLGLFGLTPPVWSANTSRVGSAGDTGLGVEFGQPMGATAKYWFTDTFAADAAGGYHFNGNFDAHADYLVHFYPNLNINAGGRLPLYIGMGGRVLLGDSSQFGFRWPVGASYLLPSDPIELFAEIAPVMRLNNIGVDVDGTVGVRIYISYLNKK